MNFLLAFLEVVFFPITMGLLLFFVLAGALVVSIVVTVITLTELIVAIKRIIVKLEKEAVGHKDELKPLLGAAVILLALYGVYWLLFLNS